MLFRPALSRQLRASATLAIAVCVACDRGARDGDIDSTGIENATITAHPVNDGARGMASRVRWAFSPDSQSMLAQEDPAGVENEAVPNGFLFARDDGAYVQRDSSWDVAPDSSWSRLAYSRAYTAFARAGDSLRANEWSALAARVGLPVAEVRRAAFPVSGMAIAFGVGRPYVVEALAGATTEAPSGSIGTRALPIAGAWRVAWSDSGGLLAIGAPGRTVNDDAPAESWIWVDPMTGQRARLGANSLVKRAPVKWTTGPTLDVSVRVDTAPRVVLAGAIEVRSEDGRVLRIAHGADGRETRRDIGPGIALAATRGGRAILALVRADTTRLPATQRHGSPWRPVVYRIVTP